MARFRILGAFIALSLLGGCVGYDIEAMRNAQPTGSEFTRALAEEYRQITVFEADEMYDWRDAGYFARKGLRAAGGEAVEPEEVANWNLPGDKVDELSSARTRLVDLLNANAREQVPQEAAHAQGRFDCWIEQQEENHQPDHIAACRDEFYAALAALEDAMKPAPMAEMPMAKPEPYVVFFAFDSAILTSEAEGIIDDAMEAAKGMTGAEFSVTGHADRAGPEDYNVRLSIRRAEAVRDALIGRGVAAGSISIAGRGEGEPAVPTADGVAEQANRRVVIIIQ
jgi:OOP family OmpA-OmpF porin